MHPLFETTRRTTADGNRPLPAADYDFRKGMWMSADGPVCDDPDRIPQTKKNDLETGEDQKGQ